MSSPYNNVAPYPIIRWAINRIIITLDGDLPDGTTSSDLSFVIATTPVAVPALTLTGGSGLTVEGREISVEISAAQSGALSEIRYCGSLWLTTGSEPLSAGTLNVIGLAYPHS